MFEPQSVAEKPTKPLLQRVKQPLQGIQMLRPQKPSPFRLPEPYCRLPWKPHPTPRQDVILDCNVETVALGYFWTPPTARAWSVQTVCQSGCFLTLTNFT